MIDLLVQNPILFVLMALSLVISISVHEFSHAYVATRFGDLTAKYLGRVTLNPAAHLDPIGMLFLLFAGFGWGKPVPFNPINLQNPKRDGAFIALAGPASNFLLAIVLSFVLRFLGGIPILYVFVYTLVTFNLTLGFFNLLPFHPLDGFKVVYGMLPLNWAWQWEQTQSYGIYVLLLLVFTHSINSVLNPLLSVSMTILGLR